MSTRGSQAFAVDLTRFGGHSFTLLTDRDKPFQEHVHHTPMSSETGSSNSPETDERPLASPRDLNRLSRLSERALHFRDFVTAFFPCSKRRSPSLLECQFAPHTANIISSADLLLAQSAERGEGHDVEPAESTLTQSREPVLPAR